MSTLTLEKEKGTMAAQCILDPKPEPPCTDFGYDGRSTGICQDGPDGGPSCSPDNILVAAQDICQSGPDGDPACSPDNLLGVCSTPSIKRSRRAIRLARQAVENYTFDQVRYRLVKDGVMPPELVEEAIAEFRKFLIVILHASGPVGMISPVVDEVWHAFILHTGDYARFCRETMGEFLHHAPNTPMSPSSPEAVPNFVNGYTKLFGELPAIWHMRLN